MTRHIKIGKPNKYQTVLLILTAIAIFFIDINQNKLLDKGLDYTTTWFGNLQTHAISNFWAGIFIYVILYMMLVSFELKVKKSHPLTTVIISMTAIFGISLLFLGFFTELYGQVVPVFTNFYEPINIYHSGIGLSLIAPIAIALVD